jgi:hypothetical protein
MMLFQYLDQLPRIPEELLVNPYIPDPKQIGFQDAGYARWAVNPELKSWLAENISADVDLAGYQVISEDVNAHCDKRLWAINYIINTGGPTVTTTLWQQPGQPVLRESRVKLPEYAKLNILESVCIEPSRWHILNTRVLHSVKGIKTERSAITVGLNNTDPFLLIKQYQGQSNGT